MNWFHIMLTMLIVGLVAGLRGFTLRKNFPKSYTPKIVQITPLYIPITQESRVESSKGIQFIWVAKYSKGGKTAKFKISFILKDISGNPPHAFTEGILMSQPDSDNTVLINDLAQYISGKVPSIKPTRLDQITFRAAILGKDLSRIKSGDNPEIAGAFLTNPKGNWISTKLFLSGPQGPESLEIFLNINLSKNIIEFSPKDSSYADDLILELQKVL